MSIKVLTRVGYEELNEKLMQLKNDRKPVADEIAEARSKGDLSENAEYHAAKEKQAMLERKIAELEHAIQNSKVVDVAQIESEVIVFGATVELLDMDSNTKKTYTIVGAMEADITKFTISIDAPLAQELIGKKVNDEVCVETPRGEKAYKVISIKFV